MIYDTFTPECAKGRGGYTDTNLCNLRKRQRLVICSCPLSSDDRIYVSGRLLRAAFHSLPGPTSTSKMEVDSTFGALFIGAFISSM